LPETAAIVPTRDLVRATARAVLRGLPDRRAADWRLSAE